MQNAWKLAGLGALALAAIVGTSTLTTAYLLRPPLSQPESTPATPAVPPESRAAIVRVARPGSRPVERIVAEAAPASSPAPAPAVATPLPSAAVAPDCDTAGDRALRLAKPGALGALLGAGLGAAGGAISNGGKGAGQGALIGGLAGAAVGAGYGAYKTQTECGTVFSAPSASSPPSAPRTGSAASGTPRYEAR